MEIFDEFEGEEYYKFPVQPQLLDTLPPDTTPTTVPASVYIWQDSLKHLLYGEWDPDHFRDTHLDAYVDMCHRFAEEVRHQQGQRKKCPSVRPLGFGTSPPTN